MQTTQTFLALAITALLTGCASFQPAKPDGYSGPVSVIQDTSNTQSSSLVHMFYLTDVDDRELKNSGIATGIANQGRGFAINPKNMRHEVPARATKLTLRGGTAYAAPILALTNPTCSVIGVVEAKLEPGKTYRINGSLSRESCAVWLEAEDSGSIVGRRVSGPGMR